MTYHRKARPCPFGLIPEEDVCGRHPHCIAHKAPVSTCPERGKGKPTELLAELERHETCEHEHSSEGCCFCKYYKHYQYAPGYHIHYHEYCEIGRKNKAFGWWENND